MEDLVMTSGDDWHHRRIKSCRDSADETRDMVESLKNVMDEHLC